MSEPSQTSSLPTTSASAAPTATTTTSDSDSFFNFSAPVSWIFIPILLLALVAASLACFTLRRRRTRPWGPTRSSEGLNELGEAPPAYEPKAQPGRSLTRSTTDGHDDDDDHDDDDGCGRGDVEMRRLERAGGASSPTQPLPVASLHAAGAAAAAPMTTTTDLPPPDYDAVQGSGGAAAPPPLITTPLPAVTRH
ncbi:hypothetical protein BN1708_012960, partial [Verticillium longisporum]